MDQAHIRNFSIIAHIDHGKSTLADRFLKPRSLQAPEMETDARHNYLQRERGITIKSTVRLNYTAKDGATVRPELHHTPGHVDFSYEVTRSLAACEGALLVVDAAQGVEAQTLANAYPAVDNNLEIIQVINKIDLPSAQPERARADRTHHRPGKHNAILASAKEGTGVAEVLEAIVSDSPRRQATRRPRSRPSSSLLVRFLSGGVIAFRVIEGAMSKIKIRLFATDQDFEVETWACRAQRHDRYARGGRGGVPHRSIKVVADAKLAIPLPRRSTDHRTVPGIQELKPMVFAGLYPVDTHQYAGLRDALEKLRLNDASFFYEPETRPPSASVFAAAFSACSTWRLSRSAWSASTTWP